MVNGQKTQVVSVEEAGRRLGISRGLAYRLAAGGELPGAIRLGRRLVVSVTALERVLAAGKWPVATGA